MYVIKYILHVLQRRCDGTHGYYQMIDLKSKKCYYIINIPWTIRVPPARLELTTFGWLELDVLRSEMLFMRPTLYRLSYRSNSFLIPWVDSFVFEPIFFN
jgi:hypothetical protein